MGAIRMLDLAGGAAGAALEAAAHAQATADNARQMVLNRDPRLSTVETATTTLAQQQVTLEALAAQLGAAVPASEVVHTALAARLTALEAKAVTVQRVSATTPGLTLLAATADIPITWPTPFADTNYSIAPQLEVTGVTLAKTTVAVKAGSKTKTGCVISYAATGIAVSAGQQLDVLAIRYG